MTSLGAEKLSKSREERLVFDNITSVKGTVYIKQYLFCYRLSSTFLLSIADQMHEGYFTYQKVHLRYMSNGLRAVPYILEVP